jgi:RHS repeat-associated protein
MSNQNTISVPSRMNSTMGKPQPPMPSLPPVLKNPTRAKQKYSPTTGQPLSPPPGWVFEQPKAMTPEQSRQWIAGNVVDPSKIYKGPVHAKSLVARPNVASNTVEGPASIAELARALKNDPQLIYEWVYNNIDWEPNWGVQKGPLGCLLDGSGNAFDQSMLLVELLKAAGYTSAGYVLGNIQLTEDQYDAWFDTAHIFAAYYYLNYANVPATFPSWNGSSYDMSMSHVWVQVNLGGTTYVMDPSYKLYNRTAAVANIDTVIGYNQASFLSDAQSGATVDPSGDFVQNMNSSKIASNLTTMTTNLTNYINSNTIGSAAPGTASVDDILGGRQIIPVTLPITFPTALPYETPGDTPSVWTDVPLSYKTTLQVQYYRNGQIPGTDPADIDQTFTSDQLAGGRLTLTYDAGLHAILTLNGSTIATGATAETAGAPGLIDLTVVHNAYSSFPQIGGHGGIYPGSYYLVGSAWGYTGRGALDFHATQSQAAQASTTATDEEKIGEKLACIFYNLSAQNCRVADFVNRIQRTQMNFFHYCGVISYYIDPVSSIPTAGTNIGLVFGFSSTLDYDFNAFQPANTCVAMHGVALEAAALAQFNGKAPGVSTTTVIDKANRTANVTVGGTPTTGDVLTVTVHDTALSGGTHSVNFTVPTGSTLTSIASGICAALNVDATLNSIGVVAASASPIVMVSSTSANQTTYSATTSSGATETLSIAWEKIYLGTTSNWTSGSNISSILSANGYDPGIISDMGSYINSSSAPVMVSERPGLTLGDWVGEGYWALFDYAHNGGAIGIINNTLKGGSGQAGDGGNSSVDTGPGQSAQAASGDPVGTATGDFFYENTDLVIGSSSFPYSLEFRRVYSSANRSSKSPLGWGWTHNHLITASVASDGLLAMGQQTGSQAVATISELFVNLNLLSAVSQPQFSTLLTASLSDKWWLDTLIDNVVVIALSDGMQNFVKQPDASYTSPYAFPVKLSLVSGLFQFKLITGEIFFFNSAGQLATWVSPAGVTVTYSYSSGLLSTISNGIGRTLTLHYTSGKLTSVSDGTGRSISYSYDGNDNLSNFANTLGNSIVYQYAQPGLLEKYFLPDNPTVAFINNTYDGLNRVAEQQNALGQGTLFYFAGSRTELVNPVGNNTVSYLNALGSIIKTINPVGDTATVIRDGLNRPIEIIFPEGNKNLRTYNLRNQILQVTRVGKPSSGLVSTVENFTYDPVWNKIATYEDANHNVTSSVYDASSGLLLTLQKPTIGGVSPTITQTWNSRGQMLTREDETGIVTQFVYDAATEVLLNQITDYGSAGAHLNLTISLAYDTVGNVNQFTDANANAITFLFDSERRLQNRFDPAPFNYQTKYNYSASGFLQSIERQTGGSPAWQTVSLTRSVSNEILSMTDPAGQSTVWTYDGADRIQTVTDAESRQWVTSYDAVGRINQITNPLNIISDFRTYTPNGRLATMLDSLSNTTQYTYDGFDRGDKMIYADGTFEQCSSYDATDNILTYLTRSGNSIIFTYDDLNRLVTKAPSGQPVCTFTYDLAGRMLQASKPTVAGDPSSGTIEFLFDTAGRPVGEQYPDGKVVALKLDSNGNSVRMTWPDGFYVERVYDALNRLTDLQLNGSSTSAVSITYNDLSQRTSLTYGNGATVVYTPSISGEVTSITHNFVGTAVTYNYTYNAVHEPVSVGVSDNSYLYYPIAGTETYDTADSVNNYPKVNGITYTYDGNKNLEGDGIWTYSYDTENHLTSAVNGVTTVILYYDPLGRQARKDAGMSQRFIYSVGERIADYNVTSGNLETRYVKGASADEVMFQIDVSGNISYLHSDAINSVIATSDGSGAVTNKNGFGPYGETTLLSGSSIGYTGQRFDSETGLYYFKARYYSPRLGRFLQPDPIGYTGHAQNLYTYVGNSPLRYVDPWGLQAYSGSIQHSDPFTDAMNSEKNLFPAPNKHNRKDVINGLDKAAEIANQMKDYMQMWKQALEDLPPKFIPQEQQTVTYGMYQPPDYVIWETFCYGIDGTYQGIGVAGVLTDGGHSPDSWPQTIHPAPVPQTYITITTVMVPNPQYYPALARAEWLYKVYAGLNEEWTKRHYGYRR